MKLTVSTQEESCYLAVEVVGDWDLEILKSLAGTLAIQTKNLKYDRVLVDAIKVSRAQQDIDRFLLGMHVASVSKGIKIAVVIPAEHIDYFFEDAAVNRGAEVSVFADKQTALQWLLEDRSNNRQSGTGNVRFSPR